MTVETGVSLDNCGGDIKFLLTKLTCQEKYLMI